VALDIEVKGDPASIRAVAAWLGTASTSVDDSGAQVRRTRGESETGWSGSAGNGFRTVASTVAAKVAELATDLGGTRDALNTHAGDLDAVKAEMARACGIASAAGLVTTETMILEPGPAPAAPTPLPTDRPATASEQQAHAAAGQAQVAHAGKVQACDACAVIVAAARAKETDSQGTLNGFLSGQAEKAPFTIANMGGGFAALSINRTSKFRARAQMFANRAARRAGLARSGGLWNLVKNTVAKEYNLYKRNAALSKATPTAWSRGLDKLPGWAKTGLTRNLSRTTPVLRRVPVVGALITAAGIGTDIAMGKNAVQSTVSGVSSLAAGAYVGAAIGGPAGLVLGAAVGAGVGFVVDEWGDDIAQGAGEAVGWAKDKVGGAVGGAAKKIGGLFS